MHRRMPRYVLVALIAFLGVAHGARAAGPADGRSPSEQMAELLVAEGPGTFAELAEPFVDPPSVDLRWVETPAELAAYFAKNSYADFIRGELGQLDLSATVPFSMDAPQPLYNKMRFMQAGGGVNLFHGHVFPEGYFRAHSDEGTSTKASILALSERQPWFRRTGDRYALQRGHTVPLLLQCLAAADGTVTLFRGAAAEEYARFQEAPVTRPGERPAVFFFTSDERWAYSWSKGIVERVSIPRKVWQGWPDRCGIYGGLEYDYVEMAFFDDPAMSWLAQHVERLTQDEVEALKARAEANPVGGGSPSKIDNPDAP